MPRLKRQREGYLCIDHTDAPGIPTGVARGAPAVGAGQKYESATCTCAHCNALVILNPDRKRPRGYCAKCDHYVCDNPQCALECNPFQRLLDDLHHQLATTGNFVLPF